MKQPYDFIVCLSLTLALCVIMPNAAVLYGCSCDCTTYVAIKWMAWHAFASFLTGWRLFTACVIIASPPRPRLTPTCLHCIATPKLRMYLVYGVVLQTEVATELLYLFTLHSNSQATDVRSMVLYYRQRLPQSSSTCLHYVATPKLRMYVVWCCTTDRGCHRAPTHCPLA